MWKIPGRTSSLLLGRVFFLKGGVLEGKKSADKLDLVRLGASAVWSEISSQSFSKDRGREGRGVLGVRTVIQFFFFTLGTQNFPILKSVFLLFRFCGVFIGNWVNSSVCPMGCCTYSDIRFIVLWFYSTNHSIQINTLYISYIKWVNRLINFFFFRFQGA